jgi:hypothetical protein
MAINKNRLTRLKYIAINAFLLFHIVAITCWAMPLDSPLLAAFKNVIRPYMLWSGLFQSWDTFAPQPKSVNSYIEAVVITHDGRTRPWKFPRMEQLSLTARYGKERYRKYVEGLKEDANLALWPDAARHIARLNNDLSSPPEIVILIRHWSDIVPYNDAAFHPEPWHTQIFYEYSVKPEDLK